MKLARRHRRHGIKIESKEGTTCMHSPVSVRGSQLTFLCQINQNSYTHRIHNRDRKLNFNHTEIDDLPSAVFVRSAPNDSDAAFESGDTSGNVESSSPRTYFMCVTCTAIGLKGGSSCSFERVLALPLPLLGRIISSDVMPRPLRTMISENTQPIRGVTCRR